MENYTAQSTSNNTKSKAIYNWLQKLQEGEASEAQSSFTAKGEPILRSGTIKMPPRSSSNLAPRTQPGRKVSIEVDCTGNKVLSTDERLIQLQEGEAIDPSGKTTKSTCPDVVGRSRSLSRSNAIKEPACPLTKDRVNLDKVGNNKSRPSETFTPKKVGFEEPNKKPQGNAIAQPAYSNSKLLAPTSQTSAAYPGKPIYRSEAAELTRSASQTARTAQKTRKSRFNELL